MFVIIMLLMGPGFAHAVIRGCRSADDRAELLLANQGSDVVMVLQTEPVDYNKYYGEKVDADVMASERVRFQIKNTDVGHVIKDKKLLVTLTTSAIFQLSRFEGEEDMAGVYAEEYIAKMLCQ